MQNILLSSNTLCINNSNQDITYLGKVYRGNGGFEIIRHIKNTNLQPDEYSIKFIYTQDLPTIKLVLETLCNDEITIICITKEYSEIMIKGRISDIKTTTTGFEITITSNIHKLTQPLVKKYSQMCRASFCDTNCRLKIAEQLHQNTVISVNQNIIILENDIPHKPWGNGFVLTQNSQKYEIKNINQKIVTLYEKSEIRENTTITLIPSCDKTLATCFKHYNNAINFQGEPFIVGQKSLDA